MKKYRPNAGVVVFNKDKLVLMCERLYGEEGNSWQFPQGGIEIDESAVDAARRELREETSVKSVKHIYTTPNACLYDFPKDVLEMSYRKGRFNDGQVQMWSLFFFEGEDSEINLNTAEPEFKNWKWVKIEEADKHVIAFKKEVYQEIIKEFKPIIENFK